MNSLEFIKMHVDEWPSTNRHQLTHCMLLSNGILTYGAGAVGRINPYEHIDLSEHFAPDYYDGVMWTREDFESYGSGENNSIEWKDTSVCYADGGQWVYFDNYLLTNDKEKLASYEEILQYEDFQLNEVLQGDCILVDEVDDEDEYHNVVDVFKLFGFPRYEDASFEYTKMSKWLVVDKDKDLVGAYLISDCQRMVTYNQLMVIGKLKRMLNKGEDTLSGHFIGLDKAIHSCDFDKIVFHSDKILEFSPNPTEGEKVNTKASKAYNLLKSMDIYYDEDLKLWYKKEFL